MLLRNAWYIGGWADELGDKPLARRICGDPVVLFRDGAGRAAALVDRCCHRAAPLHLGSLVEPALRRFGHAKLENSNHASRNVLAGELQALHRFAKRLLHDRPLPRAAAPEGAIQKRQNLVPTTEPPVQLGGVLLVRVTHFPWVPGVSFASFRACSRRSCWIRS